MSELAVASILAILLVVLCVALLTLHKVRRVHLATYQLLDDSRETHREAMSLFAQLQALLALERKLAMSQALPPMRGWAGSPDFLLHVSDEVTRRSPQVVVECSSGVSTVVIARTLQQAGRGHVFSLEHEPRYAEQTRSLLARYGLSDWATVLDAPLETVAGSSPWYSEAAMPVDMGAIELLVVDGPPAAVAPLARYPALPRLMPRSAAGVVVMMDDADRPDEQEIVRRWQQQWPKLAAEQLAAEKGLVRLTLTS
jgi:hypothetical protein